MIKLARTSMKIKGKKIKLKAFDFILVFIFVFLAVSTFIVLFRKQSNVNVVIKVNEENLFYQIGGAPIWFTQHLRPGMTEKDSFGRVTAEIKDINTYYTADQKSVVHLNVTIKAVYSPSSRHYAYKGRDLLVGSSIEIPLDNVLVKGIIIGVGGSPTHNLKKMSVQARILDYPTFGSFFSQTEGVPIYIADAVNEGDVMKDSFGNPVIKVVRKTSDDAKMVVVMTNGDVILQRNPLRKDVFLDLEVWAEKIGDRYYLFGDTSFPVMINNSSTNSSIAKAVEGLPFVNKNGFIWLTVTKINDIQ